MAITWNPYDAVQGTMSNSNRAFTGDGNFPYVPSARATHHTSAKTYAEFIATAFNSVYDISVGIVPRFSGLPFPFNEHHFADWGQYQFMNGSSSQYASADGVVNDRVCIAVDPTAGLVWVRLNGGNWNNSGTANPATGTGGVAFAGSLSGIVDVTFAMKSSNPLCTVTACFETSQWSYGAPSGFAAMLESEPTYTITSTNIITDALPGSFLTPPGRFASIGGSAYGAGGGAGNSRASAGGGGMSTRGAFSVGGGRRIYYNVGAGGVGANTTNGAAGGNTWINIAANSQPTASANGFGATAGTGNAGTTPGTGGVALYGNLRDNPGGNGYYTAAGTIGYGGGGGAGWADPGGIASNDTGGSGGYPEGGQGGTGASGTNQPGSDGVTGQAAGGGGGGGNSRAGGSGGKGRLYVWMTYDTRGVTWNPLDKDVNITLSNNNFTANGVGSGFFNALTRATAPINGKNYWEILITDNGDGIYQGVGFINDNEGTGNYINELGSTRLFGVQQNNANTPWDWIEDWSGNYDGRTDSTGVVRFAVDSTAKKLWWTTGTQSWLPSGDPAANTGGYDISTIVGRWYPTVALPGAQNQITCRFNSEEWGYSAPTGFTAISTIVDGWAHQYTSWQERVTMSTDRRTATRASVANNDQTVQSHWSKGHGKWYYEYLFTEVGAGGSVGVGFTKEGQGALGDAQYLGVDKDHSEGAYANSTVWVAWTPGYRETFVDGDVVCIAINVDTNQSWMRVNNGNWYGANTTAGDPAANTGGRQVYPSVSQGIRAAANLLDASIATSVTSRFKSDQWSYAAPSGFSAPVQPDLVTLTASIIRDLLKFSYLAAMPMFKSVSISDPLNTDNVVLFKSSEALVLKEIRSVVRGTSPSATFTVYKGQNRNGTSNTVMQSAIVCANTTTGVTTVSLANNTVATGDYVWIAVTATSGTVDELHVTLRF